MPGTRNIKAIMDDAGGDYLPLLKRRVLRASNRPRALNPDPKALKALAPPTSVPLTPEEILVSSFLCNSFAWKHGYEVGTTSDIIANGRAESWWERRLGWCLLCGRPARDLDIDRSLDARADRHIRAHLRAAAPEIEAMIALSFLSEHHWASDEERINGHPLAIAFAVEEVIGARLYSPEYRAFWYKRGGKGH